MLKGQDFFDLSDSKFSNIFDECEYVWDPLKKLKTYINEKIKPNVSCLNLADTVVSSTSVLHNGKCIYSDFDIEWGDASKGKLIVKVNGEVLEGASIICAGAVLMDKNIEIGRGSIVEPGALIKGPCIIGDNSEVRQGAYIRGNVLIGDRCVVGHTTEMKSSIMLGESKAGHFSYIGDSILGKVNLGAGTKLANLKIVDSEVILRIKDEKYETGLKKLGAILADGVETGCNTVTTPGTLLSKGVLVYPNSTCKGFHETETIVKLRQQQEYHKKNV